MLFERFARPLAAASLVTLLVNATGCSVAMAPPPPPKASLPDLGEPPPPEPVAGFSRVMISTDVPARVSYLSRGVPLETPICEATPCVVTLPYGDYILAFQGLNDGGRRSRTGIRVGRSTEVVNHTLGKNGASPLAALGLVVTIFGGLALATAVGIAEGNSERGNKTDATVGTIGVVGLGMTLFGGALFLGAPRYHQEGATTHWTPMPKETAVAGAGFRF